MSSKKLCLNCSVEQNKKRQGVEKLGGGLYSFPMPPKSVSRAKGVTSMKSSTQQTNTYELCPYHAKTILEMPAGSRILKVLPGGILHVMQPRGTKPFALEIRTFYQF